MTLIDSGTDEEALLPGLSKPWKVHYIVTQLCKYGEILTLINESGWLDEGLARYLCKQLVEAIIYLHNRGISHRDIKIDNVLLHSSLSLKLGDFGWATDEEESNRRAGTIGFNPWEMDLGLTYNCKKADVFQFGSLLIPMLFGRYAWDRMGVDNCDNYWLFKIDRQRFWK